MKRFLNFKKKETAGILFIYDNHILLTRQIDRDKHDFDYPKGSKKDFETLKECAIRETNEEIGTNLSKNFLDNINVDKIYETSEKIYYVFIYELNDYEFEHLFNTFEIPEFRLQKDEIVEAGFYSLDKALKIIDERFLKIFNNFLITDIL